MTDLITVVINNRNLLTWPRSMVSKIENYSALAEIIIVDNGSDSKPLLDWYSGLPHKVVFLENVGHKAPWHDEVKRHIRTKQYVVTDPDLDLSATPNDTLIHLSQCLKNLPDLGKIGLGLECNDIPRASPYWNHVQTYERSMWEREILIDTVRLAPVDTTFAIYSKDILDEYKICGGRTLYPYVAKHNPWYVVKPDREFRYYLSSANSSSSYLGFTKKQKTSYKIKKFFKNLFR